MSGSYDSFGMEAQADRYDNTDYFDDPFANDDFGDDVYVSREDYGLATTPEPTTSFVAPTNKHSISTGAETLSSPFNPGNIDLGAALASQYALPSAAAASSKRYLTAERRSIWGQASYNIGYSYFSGLFLGGAYGVLWGIKNCQIMNLRVLVNSILNGAGRFGSRTGNAAGMLALIYSCTERSLEDMEIDTIPRAVNRTLGIDVFRNIRNDSLIPIATAFTTGVLFTLPKAITMRGLDRRNVSFLKRVSVCSIGGLTAVAGVSVLSVVGPMVFGKRSPFRFA